MPNMTNAEPKELLKLGLNLIPVKDKRPLIKWEEFNHIRTEEAQIDGWKEAFPGCDFGIVTGPVSGLLVLDIDGEEGRKSLENLKVEMPKTWVTKTRKGWHYYFKWAEELKDVPTTKVRVWPSVDTRGSGGFVVSYPFISGHSPSDLPLSAIPEWLLRKLLVNETEERSYCPGWIQEALSNVDVGSRTHTFARIIGKLNRDGWEDEDIFALLKPHAESLDFDLVKLHEQILDMLTRYQGQAKGKEFVGTSANALLTESAPHLQWTVSPLLPKGGIGILAGAPGHGKSWLLLDMALDVSMGRPWLGRYEVTAGRVMYVDEESTRELLRHRLRKLLNFKEIDPSALRVDFYIGEGLALSDEGSVSRFRQKVASAKPSLIIMDSLIRMHRAEENNATALAQVFGVVKQICRDYGCSVMFADHLRKPSAFSQSPDQEFRGSTEKLAAIDCGIILHKIGDNLLLEQAKSRFSEPIKAVEVRIVDVGTDATSVRCF